MLSENDPSPALRILGISIGWLSAAIAKRKTRQRLITAGTNCDGLRMDILKAGMEVGARLSNILNQNDATPKVDSVFWMGLEVDLDYLFRGYCRLMAIFHCPRAIFAAGTVFCPPHDITTPLACGGTIIDRWLLGISKNALGRSSKRAPVAHD